MSGSLEHYLTQLVVIFLPIQLLSEQTRILIAAFNSILMMNSDEIVYSIHQNYSNSKSLRQWYCFLILQCIMRIWSVLIPFSKIYIMKLLIVELYLILNGMTMNNSVINYGASSNNTLILFRILLILIILILENRSYIQVYYKIIQCHCHPILQFVMTILFLIITLCKWKIMQLLIIELYLILDGMIVNIYGVSSNNTLILLTILLIIFICENREYYYYYYIQVYHKIRQWNLIYIDFKWSLPYQRCLVDKMNYASNAIELIKLYSKWIN